MAPDHFEAFRKDLHAQVTTMLGARTKEVTDRQDAMFLRLRGTNTAGMTFATGSFSVTVNRDEFHLNFPSAIADEATVAAVLAKVAEVSETHDVVLKVSRIVKGGSNFVLEGRLCDAPAPGPTP